MHAKAFVDCSGECDLVCFGRALTRYGNLGKVNLGAAIIAVKEYRLQVNDVLKGRYFEDTVATGGWGLEWKENWASEFRLPDDGCFEIPPGCLWSVDTANLFCGGTMCRRDQYAGSAMRVLRTLLVWRLR
jgi:hypothetical protein